MCSGEHEGLDDLDKLYYIDSTFGGKSPVNDEWATQVLGAPESCGQGCGSVRPGYDSRSVDVPLDHVPSVAVEAAPMALVIRRDLLEVVCGHLRSPIVGRCYGAKTGRMINEYVTLYTPAAQSVALRGGRGTRYRVCPHCGMPYLASDGTEPQAEYIVRRGTPLRHAYQMYGHGSIAVSSQVKGQLERLRLPHVEWYEYPVLPEPLDGERFEIGLA